MKYRMAKMEISRLSGKLKYTDRARETHRAKGIQRQRG